MHVNLIYLYAGSLKFRRESKSFKGGMSNKSKLKEASLKLFAAVESPEIQSGYN
jgi:hypothetical protein